MSTLKISLVVGLFFLSSAVLPASGLAAMSEFQIPASVMKAAAGQPQAAAGQQSSGAKQEVQKGQATEQRRCSTEGLDSKEIVRMAKEKVEKQRGQLAKLMALLDETKKEKDVQKINALNDKITTAKALLKNSERSLTYLEAALAKNDTAASEHEMQKICLAEQNMIQVYSEAEGVTGQAGYAGGETQVNVEETPGVADSSDKSISNMVPPPVSPTDRPPAASPFQ